MRKLLIALAVLMGVFVAAGAGWAARTILAPPAQIAQQHEYAYVAAQEGTIESTLRLSGGALWEFTEAGTNFAEGVVTEVKLIGDSSVAACDVLYLVNEVPVVAGQGAVPPYRDLSNGMHGRDVEQLQELLTECGFYSGTVDGSFNNATTQAVRAWQKSLKIPQTGHVAQGSIIYLPELPTRARLDPQHVKVGSTLNGGSNVISTLGEAPGFTSYANEQQVQRVEVGMPARIFTPHGEFDAVVAEIQPDQESGGYKVIYGAISDAPICQDKCQEFSSDVPTSFDVEIVAIAPVTGVVVPLAALGSGADGNTYVHTQSGERIAVTVRSQAHGQVIVEGLDAGEMIQVPGEDQ